MWWGRGEAAKGETNVATLKTASADRFEFPAPLRLHTVLLPYAAEASPSAHFPIILVGPEFRSRRSWPITH